MLAKDWGQWASDCEARASRPSSQPLPVITLSFEADGRTFWSERVDLSTGDVVLADVVPLRRHRS